MIFFQKEYIAFFKELEKHNHKEWFHEHKKDYETFVKKPFENFIDHLLPRVSKLDPNIQVHSKETFFRINKDIRFSKDKSPYNITMRAGMNPGGRKNMSAGFYIGIGSKGVGLGGGLHGLDKNQLQKVREHILKNTAQFKKIITDNKFVQIWGEIKGDKNKVLPSPFKEKAVQIPELLNKDFYYMHTFEDPNLTLSPKLLDFVIDKYKSALKFNNFMNNALGI